MSYSWKPLSPEASTFSPHTHTLTQCLTRTSGTFYTFAVTKPLKYPFSSFRHQMDEMAINLLFPGSQLVPNVWSARQEVLEGLSQVAPPSCSASWPASLVERVAPVPGTSGQSGSTKTPTKPGNPGASKLTPGSGKKTQPI